MMEATGTEGEEPATDAGVPAVAPPTSTDYARYSSSRFIEGVRVRFGAPGDDTFRPVEVAVSSARTADTRSVFGEWNRLLDRPLPTLPQMEWAVRLSYRQRTESVDTARVYCNTEHGDDPIRVSDPTGVPPAKLYDFIVCASAEQALTVVKRITGLDLASDLKPSVYPHERLVEPAALSDPFLFGLVDDRATTIGCRRR